jgi:four helix bundle protein
MHQFKELKGWQKLMEFASIIYSIVGTFPKDEEYGLISQMQICAISIPSNIAEGYGREGEKDIQRFLTIAKGSSFELKTQIILATNFGFISNE